MKIDGNKIQKLRKNRGLTQQELAKSLGFNISYINGIEQNKYQCIRKKANAERLAFFFRIALNDIIQKDKFELEYEAIKNLRENKGLTYKEIGKKLNRKMSQVRQVYVHFKGASGINPATYRVLNSQHYTVLEMRDNQRLSFAMIGKKLGFSKARAHQVYIHAIATLPVPIKIGKFDSPYLSNRKQQRHKAILELRDWYGWSMPEVCWHLGLGSENASHIYSEALKSLPVNMHDETNWQYPRPAAGVKDGKPSEQCGYFSFWMPRAMNEIIDNACKKLLINKSRLIRWAIMEFLSNKNLYKPITIQGEGDNNNVNVSTPHA